MTAEVDLSADPRARRVPNVPHPRQWEGYWDDIADAAKHVAQMGPELIRLAKMGGADPDGYNPSGGERGSKGGHSDPTSVAGLTRSGLPVSEDDDEKGTIPRTDPDMVAGWLEELFGHFVEARNHAMRVEALARAISNRKTGREPSGGDCLACVRYVSGTRTDRLRAGYCDSCRKAWDTYAKATPEPSHTIFRERRRAALSTEEQAS